MEGRFLVSLEGNIASGKTTALNYLEQFQDLTVLKEPIQTWENFHGTNVLELKYTHGAELEFQFLATMSRHVQEHKRSCDTGTFFLHIAQHIYETNS